MNTTSRAILDAYLRADAIVDWRDPDFPRCPITRESAGLLANQRYFNNERWVEEYFNGCHREEVFRKRWLAACGSWDDRIVVDIGCGPGNVHATLGGKPKALIGVDVGEAALRRAQGIGYTPLVCDAQALPFKAAIADLVVLNATLHHCDDMASVLSQAGALVAPGGLLVSDHDPQATAWNFSGLGRLLWEARRPLYRYTKAGFHGHRDQQAIGLASEVHHEAGLGLTPEFFRRTLEPLGFRVDVFAHNHDVGGEVLDAEHGQAKFRYRLAQRLSGIDPAEKKAALSLMCRAVREDRRSS